MLFRSGSKIIGGAMFGVSMFGGFSDSLLATEFNKISPLPNVPNISLKNGGKIPQLGFGTWTLRGSIARDSVKSALKYGYRLIDTAQYYDNEAEVYSGFIDSGLKRNEVFSTTKIPPDNMRGEKLIRASLDESLKKLGGEYIDLVLIHWPAPVLEYVKETWQIMEEYVERGKFKMIGTSNFNMKQIKDLLGYANIEPVLNQIEIHPYKSQANFVSRCQKMGIAIESWSPLGKAKILGDEIGRAHV